MQFFVFMACMFCGILSGLVYDTLYIARCVLCGIDKQNYTVKDKIFIISADIIYCLAFSAGFVFVSVMFDFEALRLYMLLGCVLGALIYIKSFHLIVAFFVKKVYNIITKDKEKHGGRTKEISPRGRNNRKRNTTDGHFSRRTYL
ncbi:MAG: hypothetical protein HDQ88_07690, partial [Clostridia bacterium]|nr:hypothetical protein [Clostridia bacterium]